MLRNEIGTNESIHRLVFPEVAKPTAQKLIKRMIDRDFLKRWPLARNRSYLRLGRAAVSRWRYPPKLVRRLGPQRLPYLLGCLSLMTYHDPPLKRLLPSELTNQFDELPRAKDLLQWAYYADDGDHGRCLVMVRVEFRLGGFSVVNKLAEQLHSYARHDGFRRLIEQQRVQVHVVTGTPDQETAVWEALRRRPLPVGLRTNHDPSLVLLH